MNLSSQTPVKQVAHILARCTPGEMPDLPPFLQVDAAEQARRIEWNTEHPLPPQAKFMDSASKPTSDADEVYQSRVAEERANAKAKRDANFQTFTQSRAQAWVMSLPNADRRWSTRLGRFIPESIIGLEKMRVVDALKAIEAAAAHAKYIAPESVKKRALKARVKAATSARHARPVKVPAPMAAKAPAPRSRGAVTGPEADAIVVEMLKRPEGVTQAQLAERLGSTGDAARGRISKVGRSKNLTITRSKQGVYSSDTIAK